MRQRTRARWPAGRWPRNKGITFLSGSKGCVAACKPVWWVRLVKGQYDVKRVFKTKRGRAEEISTKHVSPIIQDLDCKEANKEAYNYLGNKWAIKNKN